MFYEDAKNVSKRYEMKSDVILADKILKHPAEMKMVSAEKFF